MMKGFTMPENGHPWVTAPHLVYREETPRASTWRENEVHIKPHDNNVLESQKDKVGDLRTSYPASMWSVKQLRGWDGSVVKSMYYCRRPKFSSQNPQLWVSIPQLTITPAPRDPVPSSGFHWLGSHVNLYISRYTYTWGNMNTHSQIHIHMDKHKYMWSNTHTHRQTRIHIIKINQKAFNESFQILWGKHCRSLCKEDTRSVFGPSREISAREMVVDIEPFSCNQSVKTICKNCHWQVWRDFSV